MQIKLLIILILGFTTFFSLPINGYSQTAGSGKALSEQLRGAIDSRVFSDLSKAIDRPRRKAKKIPVKTTVAKIKPKTNKSVKTKRPLPEPEVVAVYDDPNVLVFKPVNNLGVDRILADALSNTPDTRNIALEMFRQTKPIYQEGAIKRGRNNDLGWAMTFFIVNCLNVYKNSAQPSEAAVENTYEVVSELMAQSSSIADASDRDKQFLHDMLVYIAGSVVITDSIGKNNNQKQITAAARESAEECLQTVLGINPDRMSFSKTGLVVK